MFYIKIKFANKKIKILFSNNHVFNPNLNDITKFKIMNEVKIIQIKTDDGFYCINDKNEYDSCVEILKEDNIENFFKIYYEKDRKEYKNKFYWSIHFYKKEQPEFSISEITNIIEQIKTNKIWNNSFIKYNFLFLLVHQL